MDSQLPRRSNCPPCSYYMKNGTCAFGSNCRYDHPPRPPQGLPDFSKSKSTTPVSWIGARSVDNQLPTRSNCPPCSYYMKNGTCAYGSGCRFDHPPRPPQDLTDFSTEKSATPVSWRGALSADNQLPTRSNCPPCSYYMKNGTCAYGSGCRFDHPPRPSNAFRNAGDSRSDCDSWIRPLQHSCAPKSITESTSSTFTDLVKSDSSTWSEREKRSFIQHVWNMFQDKDVSTFLNFIESKDGAGVKALKSLVTPAQISSMPSSEAHATSLQRVVVPLLRLVTCENLLSCKMQEPVSSVLSAIADTIDSDSLSSALKYALDGHSAQEESQLWHKAFDESHWSPSDLEEMLLPVAAFCLELLQRFHYQYFQKYMHVHDILKHWMTIFEKQPSDSELRQSLKKNIRCLVSQLEDISAKYEERHTIPDLAKTFEARAAKCLNRWPGTDLKNLCRIPSGTGVPRHDNDSKYISRISIAPTASELLCRIPPYLPPNRHSPKATELDIKDQLKHHCETHFRLLRCDLIENMGLTLRRFSDAGGLKSLVEDSEAQKICGAEAMSIGIDILRTHIYRNVAIGKFYANKSFGLIYEAQFDTPPEVLHSPLPNRKSWWKSSKRLLPGSLCCLWCGGNDIKSPHLIIGIVAERDPDKLAATRSSIGLAMLEDYYNDELVDAALGIWNLHSQEVVLIQTGPSFFGYEPFLKALKKCEMPMPEILLCSSSGPGTISIPPPQYILDGNPIFDLSFLESNNKRVLQNINVSRPQDFPKHQFALQTSLDSDQVDAIKASLTQKLALIQGQPGTGKTFVGMQIVRALAQNLKMRQILPILCVFRTKYALAQFMDGLATMGVTNTVRLDSKTTAMTMKSNSLGTSSSSLESHTLETGKHDRLKKTAQGIQKLQENLFHLKKKMLTWEMAKSIIYADAPKFEESLSGKGWKSLSRMESIWEQWLQSESAEGTAQHTQAKGNTERNRDVEKLFACEEIWSMSRKERLKLHDHWAQVLTDQFRHKLKDTAEEYMRALKSAQAAKTNEHIEVLRQASVLGVTICGLARCQDLIAGLKLKVVVVEEADKVLEAHILSAMCSETQQLILIGDCDQFRPRTELFLLKKACQLGFDLDISLLERLVSQGNIPHTRLITQRRMRPQISRLIRETVYPNLKDYQGIVASPDVRGMTRNLFFFDYEHPETSKDESTSEQNQSEAKFCILLACYLMQQGYTREGDIAVITPHANQLMTLERAASECNIKAVLDDKYVQLHNEHVEYGEEIGIQTPAHDATGVGTRIQKCLRIASLGSFLGKEARIVIFSLAGAGKPWRSRILNADNIVNVVLSRAKEGLYIVGNAQLLRADNGSGTWGSVLDILEKTGNFGSAIELRCERNPEHAISVRHWQDFQSQTEDGICSLPCNAQLACGHRCLRQCHSDDEEHKTGKCLREVSVKLPCGHFMFRVACFRAQHPETLQCQVEVTVTIDDCPDQHVHKTQCWNVDNFRHSKNSCSALVNKTMPFCRHSVTVKCGDRGNDHCPHACQRQFSTTCGHTCQGKCGDCILLTEDRLGMDLRGSGTILTPELELKMVHIPCRTKCRKTLLCGHECNKTCHYADGDCPNCERPCTHNCVHTRGACRNKCSQPCVPCAEPCVWTCPHQGPCKLPCSAPCNRLPCDMRCKLKLDCGCQCPCLCGEKCPPSDFCLNHCSDTVKTQTVDLITLETFEDLCEESVNNDPLIVLPCGHVFTMSTMDSHMELEKFYRKEISRGTIRWSAPKPVSNSIDSRKTCINCRQPIFGVFRYGRPINKTLLDQLELRFVKQCDAELREYEEEIDQLDNEVTAFEKQSSKIHQDPAHMGGLRKKISGVTSKAVSLARRSKRTPKAILRDRQEACLAENIYFGESSTNIPASSRELDSLSLIKPDLSRTCRAQLMHIKCGVTNLKILALEVTNQIKICSGIVVELQDHWSLMTKGLRAPILKFSDAVEEVYKNCDAALETAELSRSRTSQVLVLKLKLKTLVLHVEFLITTCVREVAVAHDQCISTREENCESLKHNLLKEARAICQAGLEVSTNDQQKGDFLHFQLVVKRLEKPQQRESVLKIIMIVLQADERISADNFGRGHIYTCPNGHIYIVGECGRAIEESICPDCQAPIGGVHNQLVSANSEAHDVVERLRRM